MSVPFDSPQRPPGAERFRLIETMCAEAGRVAYRERHLARLGRSARRFSFAFSKEKAQAELQRVTARLQEHGQEGPRRSLPPSTDDDNRRQRKSPPSTVRDLRFKVRLTLGPGGDFASEAAPLDEQKKQEPLRLTLAEERADSTDPFFRHKTTWRRVYRRAFERARKRGAGEAVLLNERGEVTEATRANLFVEKKGAFYTPPVRCGLLPGIGRAVWLEREHVREYVLNREDLRDADALWLVSALRGARQAAWVAGTTPSGKGKQSG